ncbi:ATP-binding cassette domain-containing protein [Parabacteroides johnsonii]|uniref:ATP-binding cassette domain-containing protein n=1 Tax=Parabacteroides johnsonii TaxID=387661 RepID=UPI001899BE7F|nr:ATP-binding cassette domain-containing protein [Parabacteroides johnsonii]
MLFKSQIEKREEQEQARLLEALERLTTAIGAHMRVRRKRHSDGDALKDILHALGVEEYTLDEDGFATPEEQLERILAAHNIMQRRVLLEGDWWKHTVGPLLGRDRQDRMVALLPDRWSRRYRYTDREGKRVAVSRRTMKERLKPEALSFYAALPNRKLGYSDLIHFAWSTVAAVDALKLLLISLVISLFGMFAPFINKQLFDNVIPNGVREGVLPLAGLLIGAGVGGALFGLLRDLLLARLRDVVKTSVQPAVMARTFSLRTTFFGRFSTGELSLRITGVTQLCELLNDTILSASLTLLFSIIYLGQMAMYAHALLLPAVCMLFAQLVLMASTFWMESRHHDHLYAVRSKMNGLVFNLFSGIQKIKLTGAERRSFARWMDDYTPAVDLKYVPLLLRLYPSLSATLQMGGTVVLYFYALRHGLTPSDYIAFTAAYGQVNGAIMGMAGIVPSLAQIKPLLRMAAPIMEEEPEVERNATTVSYLSGAIEVSNLSFRYAPDMPPVIDGLNLKIQPGEYVGIVGRSGCGKSTLLRLLLGFETPQAGSVYYDDYDLQKVNKPSLRRRIGTCLQNGSLFPGNLFSNLTITAPDATLEDAWRAARLADIDKEIAELPMGMHTLIVEGGGGFSGGQKQRMLIARALVNNPSIVFFDEATSALDNISQQQVADNMDTLGCTRLVIAHRFSTIRHCHRIIVLDKGRIAEEGTFDELMQRRGLFYEMSKRQM